MKHALPLTALLAAACATPAAELPFAPAVSETAAGKVSSAEAVRASLARIDAVDGQLQSVIALNPAALGEAEALDALRQAGDVKGPLHGVPILIKDNIETSELRTTAGSYALAENHSGADAPAIAGLKAAGAIVLGKTNLSEWANFRSNASISGWSAVGGQTRNPHSLNRTPCGSSSGSGAAVAAGLAPAAIGTETNGSIICPAAINGIVGFKPTVGLVSRTRIVPISATQDTAGPMTRSVADAALVLAAMAGSDPADPATKGADAKKPSATLRADALSGMRIGVARFAVGDDPRIEALFEEALATLEAQGAELVEIEEFAPYDALGADEYLVLKAEFKSGLDAYLAATPDSVKVRSLEELIAFNEANADEEMPLFGQDILIESQQTGGTGNAAYLEALPRLLKGTREDGIEALLAENEVAMLVAPSLRPAFLIDPVAGDNYQGGVGIGWLAAIAGTPHLTVPMGSVQGLPVGLSFLGAAYDDENVLSAGADYEAASGLIVTPTLRRDAFEAAEMAEALRRDRDPKAQ